MTEKHHKRGSTKHILRDIGRGFESVAKPVAHMVKDTVDLPSKALDKVGSIGGELALPLLLVGGVVLIVFIQNR